MRITPGYRSLVLFSVVFVTVGCALAILARRRPAPRFHTIRRPRPVETLYRNAPTRAEVLPGPDASGLIHTFEHGGGVVAVQFSPDGHTLAAVGGGTLDFWDVLTGQRLWSAKSSGECLAFAQDGKSLLVGGDDVERWDVRLHKSGRLPLAADTEDLNIRSLTFVQGGRRLIGGQDQDALIWDTRTWHRVGTLDGVWGSAVAVSRNGKVLSIGRTVCNVRTLRKKRKLIDTTGDQLVGSDALSPDGRLLITYTQRAGSYADQHMVMWDTRTGKELGQLDYNALCISAAFSPDGKLIATGGDDDSVRLWDTHRRLLSLFPCQGGPGFQCRFFSRWRSARVSEC